MIIVRHTHIIKKGEIYQKPKALIVWVGRPEFPFLFKSCEIDKSQGRLTCLATWKIRRVLQVDHQACRK